jgi:hypothetical protein
MRTLALPEAVKQWSLTSLREKLVKIGAKELPWPEVMRIIELSNAAGFEVREPELLESPDGNGEAPVEG